MLETPDMDKIISSLLTLQLLRGIIIFSFFIIVSTILGLIIDCINHLYFEWKYPKNSLYEIQKEIETKEQLDIFVYLIDEQIYYYYECYINIGISLLLGLVVIPLVLYEFLELGCLGLVSSFVVILLIIILLWKEGTNTYLQVYKYEKEFIKNIKKRREEKK